MRQRKRSDYIVNNYIYIVACMCRKLGCESAWWSRTGRLKMCTLDPRGCPEIQKSIAKGIPVIQGCSIALRGFQHGLVCCKVIGLQRLHTGLSVVKRCLRLVLPQQPLVLLHNCSVHNQPHVLPVRQLQHVIKRYQRRSFGANCCSWFGHFES